MQVWLLVSKAAAKLTPLDFEQDASVLKHQNISTADVQIDSVLHIRTHLD